MDNEQLKPTISAAENPEQAVAVMSDNTPEEVNPSSDNNVLQAAQDTAILDAANETGQNVTAEQTNPGETISVDSEEQCPEINQGAQLEEEQNPPSAQPNAAAQNDKRYQNKYAVQHRADLDAMPDGPEKNYLLDRVFPQMKYYSDNSRVNKQIYHRLTVLSLIFNGVIPIVILFEQVSCVAPFVKFAVTGLSSAAGIITAVLALKKHRELWVQYRVCLEQLKRAVSMYFLAAGEFSGLESEAENRKQTLFAVCENILVNEHNQWSALAEKETKE